MTGSANQSLQVRFENVPQRKFLNLSRDCLCDACYDANLAPFQVRTCDHILCATCWQKSACNIGGEHNQCLVCAVPTALLCFRDYKRFIAYNLYKGHLINVTATIIKSVDKSSVPWNDRLEGICALRTHEKRIFEYLQQHINKIMTNKEIKKLLTVANVDGKVDMEM